MSAIAIVVVIFLLLFAGFLAGSESAINSISRVFVEELAEKSSRRAAWVSRVLSEPARYLNVILFVRKASELTATVIVAEELRSVFQSTLQALTIAIVSMLILSYVVVGVGPRTLGKQKAGSWIVPACVTARILSTILGPITALLIAIGNAITPGKGYREGPFANEEELRDLVDQARERGLVEEEEHEMIHSVFELGDTLVRELMVPRTEIVWIERDRSIKQTLNLALRSGFSRIPVIGDDVDDIVGVAYLKDVAKRVQHDSNGGTAIRVGDVMRKPNFIPENKAATELLKDMQRDQMHMAIVIDEYGGTAGLITIEDILEEIVGEIADEYDDDIPSIEWIGDGQARVLARFHIEDLASEFETDFVAEDLEDVDTVGGLMAKHLGRVPLPGTEVEIAGLKFSAERPIGRRRKLGTVIVSKQNFEAGMHE